MRSCDFFLLFNHQPSAVVSVDFPVKLRIQLLQKMADIEWVKGKVFSEQEVYFIILRYRLASGASEKLQLGGFVAAFQCVREYAKDAAEAQTEPMVE